MKNKVLIGCPVHESKMYCLEDWIVCVKMLKGDFDIFVSDNSVSYDVRKLLKKYDIPHSYVSPTHHLRTKIMCDSHNSVRDYFLKGNYSHLLHLECDVFPPTNVIPKLLMHNKDVVTASYMIGENRDRHILAFMVEPSWFQGMQDVHKIDAYMDCLFIEGDLQKVQSCGIGCTMISKRVMQKIKFKHDPKIEAFPDSFFYYDCMMNGIPAYLDTSMLCNHRNKEWLPNIKI